MANDPENSNYKQFMARLFQSRLSTAIVVAAVVTIIAVIVFVRALPRRGSSTLSRSSELTTRQAVEDRPAQGAEPQPSPSQILSSTASSPAAKEIRSADQPTSSSSQIPDSLRNLSALQQELDQIKQEQENQIQTIASQLELITRHQESSLQNASKMAGQILELSQKAAAISTQHQESVRAIAAIEAKMGNGQGQVQETFSNAAVTTAESPGHRKDDSRESLITNTSPESRSREARLSDVSNRRADSRLADIRIPGVTATPLNKSCLQVKFDTGIFDRDDHFRIGARARLEEVAKALVQSQEDLVVYVVGLAYAEPNTWPWLEPKPNSEIALLRAVHVSTYLESLGIFPRGAILPRAGSADDFPFPTGDINNRTVLLRIFPRAYAKR